MNITKELKNKKILNNLRVTFTSIQKKKKKILSILQQKKWMIRNPMCTSLNSTYQQSKVSPSDKVTEQFLSNSLKVTFRSKNYKLGGMNPTNCHQLKIRSMDVKIYATLPVSDTPIIIGLETYLKK